MTDDKISSNGYEYYMNNSKNNDKGNNSYYLMISATSKN